MALQLNYWPCSFPLKPEWCPCDVHFIEYLRDHQITNQVIFHFGTGEHHILGEYNLALGEPNEILGITASRQEYAHYIDFIIHNPVGANYYKVIFADIYTLTPRILPQFDLVTLFHLCEFYDQEKSAYALLNDSSLLGLFLSKLHPGGRLFFYKGSAAFQKTQRIIEQYVGHKQMVQVDEYKTLLVYGQPAVDGKVAPYLT